MTLKDFERYLDLYGSNFAAWPPHLRDGAEELVASDDEAARMLEAFQRFERLFCADIPPPPLAADLVAVITARPISSERWPIGDFWRFGWLKPAILASCVLAGFAIGNVTHTNHQDIEESFNLVDGPIADTVDE